MSGLRLFTSIRSNTYIINSIKPIGSLLHRSFLPNYNHSPRIEWITGKRYKGAYEGDGKTVAFVINKRNSNVLCVESVNSFGLMLTNGAELVGSTILFPHSVISWNVTSANDVNEESLILFKVLDPKIDILIFGYGCMKDYTPEIRQRFTKICKELGLKFEALPTMQASGVYNFLASERRYVAGAFIPPTEFDTLRLTKKKFTLHDLENEESDETDELPLALDSSKDKKLIN